MKKKPDTEVVETEVLEETQEIKETEPPMKEVREGLWRNRTATEIREVVEYRGLYRATRTRSADAATRIVGDYETLEQACAAFEEREDD